MYKDMTVQLMPGAKASGYFVDLDGRERVKQEIAELMEGMDGQNISRLYHFAKELTKKE